MEKISYEVLIIGSGPAGLSAGIYAVRAGLSTLIISGGQFGGQLTQTTLVENYPGFEKGVLGPDLMDKMSKQASRIGVIIKQETVEKIDFSQKPFKAKVGNIWYEGKSVIIATGTETKWLGIPSEKKFLGRGVATCATCDGFFYKNKKVVVLGGGDTALEEALFLTKFATEVTVVHRRDSLRASKAMQDKAFDNQKIKFIWNSEVLEILGEEKVTGIKIKDKKLQKETTFFCDGVFIAIGHLPQTEIFKGQVELDEKGYIKIGLNNKETLVKEENQKYKMMTSVEGVFAAGDCHDYDYKQAITAAGFGCMAALEAEKWTQENVNF